MKRVLSAALLLAAAACRRAEVPPPARIAPASVVRSGAPRPRRLVAIDPSQTRAGAGFNVQKDGSSAILVSGWGFTREDRVFWNGSPLVTSFADATLMSAVVPKTLLARPGEARVEVRGPTEPGSAPLSARFQVTP